MDIYWSRGLTATLHKAQLFLSLLMTVDLALDSKELLFYFATCWLVVGLQGGRLNRKIDSQASW